MKSAFRVRALVRDRNSIVIGLIVATSMLPVTLVQATEIAPDPVIAENNEHALSIPPIPAVAPLVMLDDEVEAGTVKRLVLRVSESFAGSLVETPVVVVHGIEAGPALCIIAGVHGDEVNGVEVVRQSLRAISPSSLRGSVIAVPIANPSAFRRGSRYLPDRRDLNRYFPGRMLGSSASRIAYGLFDAVIRNCDALVDLHTGSFHRSNIHQLRADLADPATADLAAAFGASIVVNNSGRPGTLRRAATDEGIPAITVEAGESARFDQHHVDEALVGIMRLLESRSMIIHEPTITESAPDLNAKLARDFMLKTSLQIDSPNKDDAPEITAYLKTRWVRCDHGGILVSRVSLGDEVLAGQLLGTISDPLSDQMDDVTSPLSGRVIGMAIDQVVMPGFAAYHLGYQARVLGRIGSEAAEVGAEHRSVEDSEGLDLEERPE